LSEKKPTFKQLLNSIKTSKSAAIRIVCTAEQRLMVEKCLTVAIQFPYVDKRKYATTLFMPVGSKIVILHERLIGPMFKSKIDFDVRKLPEEQISTLFKLR